jgi:hypothetical protein
MDAVEAAFFPAAVLPLLILSSDGRCLPMLCLGLRDSRSPFSDAPASVLRRLDAEVGLMPAPASGLHGTAAQFAMERCGGTSFNRTVTDLCAVECTESAYTRADKIATTTWAFYSCSRFDPAQHAPVQSSQVLCWPHQEGGDAPLPSPPGADQLCMLINHTDAITEEAHHDPRRLVPSTQTASPPRRG